MIRTALLAALAAALAAPALAAPRQIPCGLGPHGKITQLNAERVVTRLDTADQRDIRFEYRLVLRNPHAQPAEVIPGLDLPQVREAAPLPVSVPPRATVEVLLGWVPVSDPIRRGAPPSAEEVQRSLTLEACHVGPPAPARHLA
jgi:hypothetical protein